MLALSILNISGDSYGSIDDPTLRPGVVLGPEVEGVLSGVAGAVLGWTLIGISFLKNPVVQLSTEVSYSCRRY